jgi:hypothetical protein
MSLRATASRGTSKDRAKRRALVTAGIEQGAGEPIRPLSAAARLTPGSSLWWHQQLMESSGQVLDDRAAVAVVIDALYQLLSFEPGAEPDWQGFRSHFEPFAVLALRVFPTDENVSVMSLREYMRQQMRQGLKEEGYTETAGERYVEVVGDVASVRQDFTMNFASADPVPAVDLFLLVKRDSQWRIVSVVSDMQPVRRA